MSGPLRGGAPNSLQAARGNGVTFRNEGSRSHASEDYDEVAIPVWQVSPAWDSSRDATDNGRFARRGRPWGVKPT